MLLAKSEIIPMILGEAYFQQHSASLSDTIQKPEKIKNRIKSLNNIENNFNYFQTGLDSSLRIVLRPLIIKSNDVIGIQVGSLSINQEQISFFKNGNGSEGYLVDNNGLIKLPIIGPIMVAGKTRACLADTLEQILKARDLVKDPFVDVRFISIKVTVMGEVGSPGIRNFATDRITLLDAILASGGINETGIKNDVRIIRETDGIIKVIHVNLLDASYIGSSVYQLEQNDIIYVDADNVKLKQLKRGRNTFIRDFTTGISLLSSFFLIINIINLFK